MKCVVVYFFIASTVGYRWNLDYRTPRNQYRNPTSPDNDFWRNYQHHVDSNIIPAELPYDPHRTWKNEMNQRSFLGSPGSSDRTVNQNKGIGTYRLRNSGYRNFFNFGRNLTDGLPTVIFETNGNFYLPVWQESSPTSLSRSPKSFYKRQPSNRTSISKDRGYQSSIQDTILGLKFAEYGNEWRPETSQPYEIYPMNIYEEKNFGEKWQPFSEEGLMDPSTRADVHLSSGSGSYFQYYPSPSEEYVVGDVAPAETAQHRDMYKSLLLTPLSRFHSKILPFSVNMLDILGATKNREDSSLPERNDHSHLKPENTYSSQSPSYFQSLRDNSAGYDGSTIARNNHTHHRGTRAVSATDLLSSFCHSRHLHECGGAVIRQFDLDPDSTNKCKIREDFLDCMVQQRAAGCHSTQELNYSPEDTNQLRSKIKSLLWSAHGCLFGK